MTDPVGEGAVSDVVWYFITTWDCVLCGRSEEYRERQHGPRPERYEDRHEHHETACCGHFI